MAAYILSVVEITNPTPNLKKYTEESARLARSHGGKYIVRGKSAAVVSGDLLGKKVVVMLEFPSMENLKAFYESDDYQKGCRPLREGTGIYDIGFFESPPPAMA
ncbi:MAG: DUF1330 domain-containing protein [Gammaproteobacteria bacterium]|nr:DUF1330 domain-containing protein [Gammaproteobacteria bacterium]